LRKKGWPKLAERLLIGPKGFKIKTLLIIGCGGHSGPVFEIAHADNRWKQIYFLNHNQENKETYLFGKKVLQGFSKIKLFDRKKTSIFIAIGNNKTRKQLIKKLKMDRFNLPNLIHSKALVSESAKISEANFIGPFANIGAKVKLGTGNIINSFANLEHDVKIGSFCQIGPGAQICGKSEIEDEVFIGCNSTVIEKLKIRTKTIIGAGTVVLQDIQKPGSKIVGNPGRKI